MSKKEPITVCCSQCGTSFPSTMWTEIISTEGNDRVWFAIDDNPFSRKCPSCGHFQRVVYDLFYCDERRKVMVLFIAQPDAPDFDARVAQAKAAHPPKPGYMTRMVHSPTDLRATFLALTAGWDDRIIQILKLLYRCQTLQTVKDVHIKTIIYKHDYQCDEDYISFHGEQDGKPLRWYDIPNELMWATHDSHIGKLNALEEEPYPVYDIQWAERYYFGQVSTAPVKEDAAPLQEQAPASDDASRARTAYMTHLREVADDILNAAQAGVPTATFDEMISWLTDDMMQWVKLLAPMLNSPDGIDQPTRNTALLLRGLSVLLHNDHKKTEEALTIIHALWQIFIPDKQLYDQFCEDAEFLHKLLWNRADYMLELLELLKAHSEAICSSGCNNADDYIAEIRQANHQAKRLRRANQLQAKRREEIFNQARASAIKLHRNFSQSLQAKKIIAALNEEFSDLPSLKELIDSDLQMLDEKPAEIPSEETVIPHH